MSAKLAILLYIPYSPQKNALQVFLLAGRYSLNYFIRCLLLLQVLHSLTVSEAVDNQTALNLCAVYALSVSSVRSHHL